MMRGSLRAKEKVTWLYLRACKNSKKDRMN